MQNYDQLSTRQGKKQKGGKSLSTVAESKQGNSKTRAFCVLLSGCVART